MTSSLKDSDGFYFLAYPASISSCGGINDDSVVVPRFDVVEGSLKVLSGIVQRRRCVCRLKIRVNKLNQPVQILSRNGLILLVEEINVSV
jgi:hypothetical protein